MSSTFKTLSSSSILSVFESAPIKCIYAITHVLDL